MKVNGASIYGTTASPFATQLSFGRATSKPGKILLHVFDWPADGILRTPALATGVKKAYLLTDPGRSFKFTQTSSGFEVAVPKAAPDSIDTVIILETHG
jgi:alpha-L-fucosidase